MTSVHLICYDLSMKIYYVRDFRKKLKEAFDKANVEEEVFVNRNGVFYKLYQTSKQEECRRAWDEQVENSNV